MCTWRSIQSRRTKKLDKPAVARTTPPPGQRERAPSEETSSFAVTGTEAILGPSVKRDTTIHLQLDVEHDLESRLEEFSRLKRLGDFLGANKYFEANLQEFIHISPVSVELADMLLAQGAYKRLKELRMRNELNPPLNPDELISHKSESRSDDHFRSLSNTSYPRTQTSSMAKQPDSGVDRFDITFLLIEATSSMYSEGSLRRALRLAKPDDTRAEPKLNFIAQHTAFFGNPDI
ncbi:hypothetical protein BKA64DRAFT_763792 [Cadophora sp. MPI-SDFR-AT-0126]|nr:hypothetical protein BKA64DRAFT_763792 [Leotiomycetes sp. MPI-SDFR-AT-0126]